MFKKKEVSINIPPIERKFFDVTVVGLDPLIQHRFSEKAKRQIEEKQQKKANNTKKEKRNPEQEFKDSMYVFSNGTPKDTVYGFPARAFKSACMEACSIANVFKTQARGTFYIHGENGSELVKLIDPKTGRPAKPTMRTDPVTIGMGIRDMRYRGEFKSWSAKLRIEYNPAVLSPEQIINLLNNAGFACGVGEQRPSAPNNPGDVYGRFEVMEGKQ